MRKSQKYLILVIAIIVLSLSLGMHSHPTQAVAFDEVPTVVEPTEIDSATADLWAKTYGGGQESEANATVATSDGGYIVAGWTLSFGSGGRDYWVVKLDNRGIPQWQKAYGGSGDDIARTILETSDGGYLVAGSSRSFGAGSEDYWVLKLDSDGSINWQKTYAGSGLDRAKAVAETNDGYVVAGRTNSFGAGEDDFWVLKLNYDGTVAWENTYGGSSYDYAQSIQALDGVNGGYIVAGWTYSFGAGGWDYWVLKLDSIGSIVWQHTYGGYPGTDVANSIQETSDGGYIVAGWTNSFNGLEDYWVLKLNNDGSIAWQKSYGGEGVEEAGSIQETNDGGYIVAGNSNSFGAGLEDYWVVKLNSDGTIAWQKAYGGSNVDQASSIQELSNGGYIVAGYTSSFGTGNKDFWVLKLNSDGSIADCPLIVDTDAVSVTTDVSGDVSSAIPASNGITSNDSSAVGVDSNALISEQCFASSCSLTLQANYTQGQISLDYDLYTGINPVTWHNSLIVQNSYLPLWSAYLPANYQGLSNPITFPFPNLGNVIFVTYFTTPENGAICADLDIVETGLTPPN